MKEINILRAVPFLSSGFPVWCRPSFPSFAGLSEGTGGLWPQLPGEGSLLVQITFPGYWLALWPTLRTHTAAILRSPQRQDAQDTASSGIPVQRRQPEWVKISVGECVAQMSIVILWGRGRGGSCFCGDGLEPLMLGNSFTTEVHSPAPVTQFHPHTTQFLFPAFSCCSSNCGLFPVATWYIIHSALIVLTSQQSWR